MTSQIFAYALAACLGIGFVAAAVWDWRTRTIPNRLNLAIALGAPFYWIAAGISWQEMAFTAGIALIVFVIFMIPFALNQMGGGDLKLIGAAALWFPATEVGRFLLIMACVGAALTLAFFIHHRSTKAPGPSWTPYGIAISVGGLWVLSERFINQFQ